MHCFRSTIVTVLLSLCSYSKVVNLQLLNDSNRIAVASSLTAAEPSHNVHQAQPKSASSSSFPSLVRYDLVPEVHIQCNSNSITVTISTNQDFNGMIYPKGLSKNSTCMSEYSGKSSIVYTLPLRSCNTMSTGVDEGIEYFNTIMLQPHRRLVTSQGRGYHIRCRYQTKEKTISSSHGAGGSSTSGGSSQTLAKTPGQSQDPLAAQNGGTIVLDHQSMGGHHEASQLNVTLGTSQPIVASAPIPSCSMRILSAANPNSDQSIAENVKIGDKLQLVVTLDEQEVYGMVVTNCLVRDGLNWAEQPLINDEGCPIDEEIMPRFEYNSNATRATVTFQAHKFPYTSSVYYQCNVRLCLRDSGCDTLMPDCNGSNLVRRKRYVDGGELDATAPAEILAPQAAQLRRDMSMEVFSGLNVDESEATSDSTAPNVTSGGPSGDFPSSTGDSESTDDERDRSAQRSEQEFCMSMRKFALAISLASLLLMLAVILLAACVLHRRKQKAKQASSHAGSVYSTGPYANRGYTRD